MDKPFVRLVRIEASIFGSVDSYGPETGIGWICGIDEKLWIGGMKLWMIQRTDAVQDYPRVRSIGSKNEQAGFSTF